MKTLSGKIAISITYLERIALPPATVTVRLVRVATDSKLSAIAMSAAAAAIMTQTIETGDKQVPFAFELSYENLDSQASYALEAEIAYDGQARWRNAKPVIVLSSAETVNDITIRLSQALNAADDQVPAGLITSTATSAPAVNTLAGTSWQLQSSSQDGAAVPELGATLIFSDYGKVSGHAGCNRLAGAYALTADMLKLTALATTMMACAEPVMKQESWYVKSLATAARYEVQGTTLRIYFGSESACLTFSRT